MGVPVSITPFRRQRLHRREQPHLSALSGFPPLNRFPILHQFVALAISASKRPGIRLYRLGQNPGIKILDTLKPRS